MGSFEGNTFISVIPIIHFVLRSYRREHIRRLPIIRPSRTINLIHAEFWIVDGVNDALVFDNDAGMICVCRCRASLGCLPWN